MSSTTRDVSHLSDISKSISEPDGSFNRKPSVFRNFVEKGGAFAPEKGRYHLYVSYACPWATRTLIVRKIKGLEEFIDVSVVSPRMGAHGWPFANVDAFPGADADPLFGAEHVKDLYMRVNPDYEGRFTVPILWDKKTSAIVNNESSEIIRMFNTAFNDQLPSDKAAIDLYPEALRGEIDGINEWVYDTVNNGVYKSGFATSQKAYEAAVVPLFESLDRLEKILTGKDYLVGDQLTEADIRLFVTIVRFDPVYVGHFKCNIRTIRDGYPAIDLWMRKLYWNNSAFSSTCNFEHIKTHYYWSHPQINPHRVVPVGPIPNILPL
ncbi:glutathione S-transferase [Trametes versicolor FP-101664 SS1]|nr:glutathione S-transferase [Trametes versicolor FP-101664 SS1]EIW54853.1 glutathione S-transferase [Trametes versicolor FP-101664 SS1]